MNATTKPTTTQAPHRGNYGELIAEIGIVEMTVRGRRVFRARNTNGEYILPVRDPRKACPVMFYTRLMNQFIDDLAANPDSHGWDGIGTCAFDRKLRGQALNVDLYGYGRDIHDGGDLVVIQVRQYEKRHAGWFPQVRKNYYLVGRNEDGTVFAHPVESAVIHSAIRRGVDVVTAVQTWMFGHDYSGLVRQGDVAVRPCSLPAGAKIPGSVFSLPENHNWTAAAVMMRGDRLYMQDVYIEHPTHPAIYQPGWSEIVVARRANTWDFATPTID